MISLLTLHVAIVKRELNAGVTERADLIRAVTKWHKACNDSAWSEKSSEMIVDVVLALIKSTEDAQL